MSSSAASAPRCSGRTASAPASSCTSCSAAVLARRGWCASTDERSLATLATKILAGRADETAPGFVEVRAGIAVARGGLDAVFEDLGDASLCVLDEAAADIRDVPDDGLDDVAFFLGDHLGFEGAHRAWLVSRGARAVRVGPRSLHAEDAIAIVLNEIDRRDAPRGLLPPLA
jgi:tRNA (pseudouridine54-N1)-methyltransferase